MDLYENLEKLCRTLGKEIDTVNEKLERSNDKLSGDDLSYVDKLTHALKSIKTTMAMMDADGYSHDRYGMMYDGRSGARERNPRRDSMGRYSRDHWDYSGKGYSRDGKHEEMIEQLNEAMHGAPNDRIRQSIEKVIREVEQM